MIPVNMDIENSIRQPECTADSQKWLPHVSCAVHVLEIAFDGYVGAELLDA